jgi:hypothetical protein|nr:MAG TPA: Nucleotide modification associated domain 1 [Crassvirales sp.]
MIEIEFNIEKDLATKEVADFIKQSVDCAELYAKKNHDYGDSFSKGCDVIGDAYAVGRLYDKMNRLITLSKVESEVKDESIEDTLRDLACYSLMYLAYLDNKKKDNHNDVVLD